MGYSTYRPPGLRPPANGDTVRVTITVDLGRELSLGDVAAYLTDVASLVDVGQQWGIELARAAIDWDHTYRGQTHRGERRHEPGYEVYRGLQSEGYEFTPPYPGALWEWAPGEHIAWRTLRDVRARRLLGTRTTAQSVRCQNPLEVILLGSGMSIAGVILVARTVRDWSSTRRIGDATAREAEAEARMTEARAELYEHLVTQTKQGQTPVPVGDLVQIMTPAEIKALNRLAERPITLELPGRADKSPN